MAERPSPVRADRDVLPPWLYPAAFWVVTVLLAVGVVVPAVMPLAVLVLLVTPVVAAVVVIVTHVRHDRSLGVAALVALAGLAAVFVLRRFIE